MEYNVYVLKNNCAQGLNNKNSECDKILNIGKLKQETSPLNLKSESTVPQYCQ